MIEKSHSASAARSTAQIEVVGIRGKEEGPRVIVLAKRQSYELVTISLDYDQRSRKGLENAKDITNALATKNDVLAKFGPRTGESAVLETLPAHKLIEVNPEDYWVNINITSGHIAAYQRARDLSADDAQFSDPRGGNGPKRVSIFV